MVFSRPIVSETQPKNGRPKPSKMRSSEIANVNAAIWKPASVTGVSAILKSCAIGAICAAVIRPPAATMTNTRYITQKIGAAQHLRRGEVDLGLRQIELLLLRPASPSDGGA